MEFGSVWGRIKWKRSVLHIVRWGRDSLTEKMDYKDDSDIYGHSAGSDVEGDVSDDSAE